MISLTHYRRLPLEGLKNARELGGYPTGSGGATRFGIFIRSEVPEHLTENDFEFLKDYGVTDVIDFRGHQETERSADVLACMPWVCYHHLPMSDRNAARGALPETGASDGGFFWGDHYIVMADKAKQWVREVLETLAAATGCALFHCTTGKDRTGLITALLLGLCGVCDEDIAADYCISSLYLGGIYARMHFFMTGLDDGDFSDPFFSTAAENMQFLLRHWHTKYGGIEGYVRDCGVETSVIEMLRRKLCGSSL